MGTKRAVPPIPDRPHMVRGAVPDRVYLARGCRTVKTLKGTGGAVPDRP